MNETQKRFRESRVNKAFRFELVLCDEHGGYRHKGRLAL